VAPTLPLACSPIVSHAVSFPVSHFRPNTAQSLKTPTVWKFATSNSNIFPWPMKNLAILLTASSLVNESSGTTWGTTGQ